MGLGGRFIDVSLGVGGGGYHGLEGWLFDFGGDWLERYGFSVSTLFH